jgi:NADPH:quinone reductase-like Zn-dependent oxidoreductase
MVEEYQAIRFHEYGGSDKLVLETVPRPTLKADEVLIKVHFAGVNPIDWKIRSGSLKDFMPVSLPCIPGIEASGVIAEVGPEARNLKIGQAVFGIVSGAYAQYAVAKAGDIVPKPDSVGFEEAAAVSVGALTAWQAVEEAGVAKGHSVAILGGAGGVGLFAVQFSRMKGAAVVGTASGNNLTYVRAIGAERAVDYRNASWESEIKNADIVIDTVGGQALESAYGLLKPGGTLVTIAGRVSEEKAKERGIKAMVSGRGSTALLKEIAALLAKRGIRSEAGRIFTLNKAKDAQDQSQTGHGRGRILLKA